MRIRGKFIVFEGGEGAGKTAIMEKAAHVIDKDKVIVTREPGGTPLGEEIRKLLLDPQWKERDLRTELLLFFAQRAEHVRQVIRPHLEAGIHVLCNRFDISTYAYQLSGREQPGLWYQHQSLNDFATGGLVPDHYIVFDVPIEAGLARVQDRDDVESLFKRERVEFHERVRRGFVNFVNKSPEKCSWIDASKDLASIETQVVRLVCDLVEEGTEEKPPLRAYAT